MQAHRGSSSFPSCLRARSGTRLARRLLTMAVFLASLSTAARARADDDPWFGRDKVLHFSISALLAGGAYTVTATQSRSRFVPLLVGGGVALAAGAAKEGVDALGFGTASWKDFAWDAAGTIVGLGIAWSLDLLLRGVSAEHPLFAPPDVEHVASSSGGFTATPRKLSPDRTPKLARLLLWRFP